MNVFLKLTISLFILTFSLTLGLPAARKSRPNVRVFGGDDASPGQFPFVVSLQVFGSIPNCAGSIINENWIVTAAHCVVNFSPTDIMVLAGTNLLGTGGTLFNMSKIIVHSGYTVANDTNDLALVKIDGAFKFDDLVQMIEIGQVSGNDPVTVIGWGETEEGFGNVLQYASLTALSDEDCTKKSEGGEYVLPRGPGQVCALASKGIAPCHGDSGGPLIFNNTQVGIVSYAISPCAKGYPDVYTRIGYYVEWINNIIKNN